MSFRNNYSRIDCLLQRLAFSSLNIQKAVADIEDQVYSKKFKHLTITKPVFITSLPRAGTTLLLELIGSLKKFAAHTYREMPFLLLPLLWNEISHRFRQSNTSIERAHGDGMKINFDSPEAFEEIIWHAFWPEKYEHDKIEPWQKGELDKDREFNSFIKNHIKKLIYLRGPHSEASRYVSKNNANISRIPKILELFPDAIILIPFRNPVDHTASMLNQHIHFNKIHSEDEFAKKYMADIGHFDFGENFRPINLGGWLKQNNNEPNSPNFWLAYWQASFNYLYKNYKDRLVFIDYEKCCEQPAAYLEKIAMQIKQDNKEQLSGLAHHFRKPNHYDQDKFGFNSQLLTECKNLHKDLQKTAIA